VGAGATVRLNSNTFVNNASGIDNAGIAQSAGNNKFLGNVNDLVGSALVGGVSTF